MKTLQQLALEKVINTSSTVLDAAHHFENIDISQFAPS